MDKIEKPKRRFFFRRAKRKRLEYIALLPSLVTLINGVCGFAAIGLAARGPEHFVMAGVMIYLAMIADMLDGRLARNLDSFPTVMKQMRKAKTWYAPE